MSAVGEERTTTAPGLPQGPEADAGPGARTRMATAAMAARPSVRPARTAISGTPFPYQ
jgi:hypothetical protein